MALLTVAWLVPMHLCDECWCIAVFLIRISVIFGHRFVACSYSQCSRLLEKKYIEPTVS